MGKARRMFRTFFVIISRTFGQEISVYCSNFSNLTEAICCRQVRWFRPSRKDVDHSRDSECDHEQLPPDVLYAEHRAAAEDHNRDAGDPFDSRRDPFVLVEVAQGGTEPFVIEQPGLQLGASLLERRECQDQKDRARQARQDIANKPDSNQNQAQGGPALARHAHTIYS